MSDSSEPTQPTDEELARRVQRGEEEALAMLMQRYQPKLMRYGNRFLGGQGTDVLQQAVQDIFIAAYENIEGFDATQRFSPWLYRIAHNAFVDILRKRSKQPIYGIDFDALISHPIHEDTYAKEKESEEMRVLLEKGLGLLSAAQREILVLYYFEDLSYREISDVLHVPVSTVGVRLIRAREALKRNLPESHDLPI